MRCVSFGGANWGSRRRSWKVWREGQELVAWSACRRLRSSWWMAVYVALKCPLDGVVCVMDVLKLESEGFGVRERRVAEWECWLGKVVEEVCAIIYGA